MLTSANVTAKMAWTYYEAENYYTKGQALAPALWYGKFAHALGLQGEIAQGDFENMIKGCDPQGHALVSNSTKVQQEKPQVDLELRQSIVADLQKFALENELGNSEKAHALISRFEKNLENGPVTKLVLAKTTKKFTALLEQESTLSGVQIADRRAQIATILERGAGARERRAALDLVFCAPKSVSLQALVFGDVRLVEAHRRATKTVLQHIEEKYSQCRTGGQNDRKVLDTGQIAVAQFEHDLSREMDPHLHTHNVMLNMTFDGKKVKALHNDEFYQHRRLLGTMYQNELAILVRELGYDIDLGKNGTFEIAGFSREQIEGFSKRHVAIWDNTITSQAEASKHFFDGREAKSEQIDRQLLKTNWLETAKALEFKNVVSKAVPGTKLSPLVHVPLAAQVEALTEKSVALELKDLQISHLSRHLGSVPTFTALRDAQSYANMNLIPGKKPNQYTTQSAYQIELHSSFKVIEGAGRFVPVYDKEKLATYEQQLLLGNKITDQQKHVAIRNLRERLETTKIRPETQDKITTLVSKAIANDDKLSQTQLLHFRREIQTELRSSGLKGKELSDTFSLVLTPLEKQIQAMTPGQVNAISKTLASTDQYIVWQGVAGSGKTFSMRKVVEQFQNQGIEVIGLATSATAAKQLGKDAGIDADTVDSHILRTKSKLEIGTFVSLELQQNIVPTQLWIVDEAGMLSAKKFLELTEAAAQQKARVLLSGDVRQIAAVEAGNPFFDIQKHNHATIVHLEESVRQKNPDLQEAVSKIYNKKAKEAFQGLVRKTVELDKMEDRCEAAAREFLKRSKLERDNLILIAKTNKERELITQIVRDGLKAEGMLGTEREMKILKNVDLDGVSKTMANSYEQGMVVKFNETGLLKLKKDLPYQVVHVDNIENIVVLKSEKGKPQRVKAQSLKNASVFREASIQVSPGDKIQWTRNERGHERLNNSLFQVADIQGDQLILRREDGREHIASLRQSHHADHAWAITVHKSQGQTAREVLFVADRSTTAAELLVGVTRATHEVTLFVHDKEEIQKIADRAEIKERAQDVADIWDAEKYLERPISESAEMRRTPILLDCEGVAPLVGNADLESARLQKRMEALVGFAFDFSNEAKVATEERTTEMEDRCDIGSLENSKKSLEKSKAAKEEIKPKEIEFEF